MFVGNNGSREASASRPERAMPASLVSKPTRPGLAKGKEVSKLVLRGQSGLCPQINHMVQNEYQILHQDFPRA